MAPDEAHQGEGSFFVGGEQWNRMRKQRGWPSTGLPTTGLLCPAKAHLLLPKYTQDAFSLFLCFRLEIG